MPIFDFSCQACNTVFETMVRASDVVACPNCGCQQVEKLISAPSAPGTSKAIIASARRQAASQGHFSHYSKRERPGAR